MDESGMFLFSSPNPAMHTGGFGVENPAVEMRS